MNTTFPWDITARTNITDGYNTTFCVRCSNAWDSIEEDDIVFTQYRQVPWVIILPIVAVVVALAIGAIGYAVGKKSVPAAAEGTEMQGYETGRQESTQGGDTARSEKANQ